ncbi:calcium-binding protein [Phenylobacterium sp.]|uniref:calcium-binding protein n=1 Tax=Phenylobacterium sp. TaxID=1871053 RepID=UPI00301BB2CB
MSGFDGNQETIIAFAYGYSSPTPIIINGWTFNGTSSDEVIGGSDYQTQVRFVSGNWLTDIQYGTDTLNGGSGNDYIDGVGASDSISGGDGNDTVSGGDGDDFVHGNSGNDQVIGGNGNDTVRGGQGNDTISGSDGNDFISGDAGDDLLYGNTGADTFNFSLGFGNDTIADFDRNSGDSVRIESGSYTLSQVGSNTIVLMSDGSALTILNTSYASLDSGWIHT